MASPLVSFPDQADIHGQSARHNEFALQTKDKKAHNPLHPPVPSWVETRFDKGWRLIFLVNLKYSIKNSNKFSPNPSSIPDFSFP
jgi:hypothetical protein